MTKTARKLPWWLIQSILCGFEVLRLRDGCIPAASTESGCEREALINVCNMSLVAGIVQKRTATTGA